MIGFRDGFIERIKGEMEVELREAGNVDAREEATALLMDTLDALEREGGVLGRADHRPVAE